MVRTGEIKNQVGIDFYTIYLLDKNFGSMLAPSWELVSLWYKIGELIGFDREDAKHELEQIHWYHDQGEMDKPSQKVKRIKK